MFCYPACLLGLDAGLAAPRAALVDRQATKLFRTGISLDEPIGSKLSFCRVSGKDDRGYGFRCLSPIDTTPKSTFDPTFPGRTAIPGGMGGFATTEGSSECRAEG
jgi:hypothetical protein